MNIATGEVFTGRDKGLTGSDILRFFQQIDATVPQGLHLGLSFPDPDLRFEDGHWRFGAIDWAEFRRVVAGDGPLNRERLAARKQAHEDGGWVREAALAFAAKRRARQRAA